MKTTKKAAKVSKTNKAKKASAKKATVKTEVLKTKVVSEYSKKVLGVNSELKKQIRSLGGCRSVLITFQNEIGLTGNQKRLLKASKAKENYEILKPLVRISKAGNYSPFFLLQALYKYETKLLTSFKF